MSATVADLPNDIPSVALPFEDGADEADEKRKRAIEAGPVLDQERDAPPLNIAGEKEKKRGGKIKRFLFCALLFVVLIVIVFGAIWYTVGTAAKGKNDQSKNQSSAANSNKSTTPDTDEQKYNAALQNLVVQNLATKDVPKDGARQDGLGGPKVNETDSNLTGPKQNGSESLADRDNRRADSDTTSQSQTSAALKTDGTAAEGTKTVLGRVPANGTTVAAATSAHSTLFNPRVKEARFEGTDRPKDNAARPDARRAESLAEVRLPTFGTILPVRSLGVIYTLRSSGSLVRFELTREMSGPGWTMHKGTVIVGTVRSSQTDRAFISMIGFIDPQTGGFVKETGDLLGGDGASGVRGKKRKISNGFSHVLNRLASAGLNIAESVIAGSGRGTVVITDAYSRGAAPLTSELTGIVGNNNNEFVEVKAGTSAYVMITQLPGEIHGVEELSRMPAEDLRNLSDPDWRRPATGLSETQLAELLTRGDEGEIRRALPEMTPEMRRLAEGVLAGGER